MADKSVAVKISFEVAKAQEGLKKLASETQKATDEIKKIDGATKSSTLGFGGMAGAVFTGIASFEALKKVASTVVNFIGSAVTESFAAAEAMARVETNVRNAGLQYDDIIPKLKSYSESMIKMGFDDEATAESVSRLALVTKDYDQALKLNQLAMDVARNKNIDLATATTLVTQVTQGNGRVLKQYGIELSETASAADNLATLQDKVKGSTEAFAETAPGKLAAVKAEWGNMKEELGDKLQPALMELLELFQSMMPGIIMLVNKLGTALGWVGDQIEGVNALFQIWSGTLEQNAALNTKLGPQMEAVIDKFNELHPKAKVSYDDFKLMNFELQKNIIHSGNAALKAEGLAGSIDKTSTSFKGIGVASKASGQEIEKQQQAMKLLGDAVMEVQRGVDGFSVASEEDFKKFSMLMEDTKMDVEKFVTASKRGFDSFKSTIGGLNTEIKNLEGQLQKAKDSFADFLKSTKDQAAGDFARIIVDAEKAIPELEKQLQEAQAGGDSDQTAEIQKQLAEKQSILASAQKEEYTSNEQLQSELQFLRENSQKNELDAAAATMQRKIEMRTEEFNKEIEFLNQQITKKTEERDNYIAAQAAMTNAFAANATIRKKTAGAEADAMKTLTASVNEAAAAYARLASSRGGGGVKAFAEGGVVTSPTLALIGEKGPERVEPIGRGSSGGSGITVNFNNPSVRNDGDLATLVRVVEDVLARKQELAEFGSYK